MNRLGGALFVLLRIAILRAESPSLIGRGYGEPCTCDRDCDLNQWLTCQEGICICLSSTFQFDHVRRSCVVRLGHKCFEVAGEKYADLPPSIRCVEGAFCSISAGGLCACNTYGWYVSDDGHRCEQRKNFGSTCGSHLQCQTDACSGGICSCRDGQYYDTEQDKCLGLVGSFCFTDAECTLNAVCRESAKCGCGPGFSSTSDLLCATRLKLGDNCSSSTPCNNPGLACNSKKCACRYPQHQMVDPETGSCKSLVASAPCTEDNSCVSGAKCIHVESGLSECRCSPDHLEMEDGSCKRFKTIGAPCLTDQECDPMTPLVCKDSACDCPDSLSNFDPERRLCRGLHGYRGCTNDQSCTKFANCVQYNNKLPAKCICQTPSYKPSVNRTCISV